MFWYATLRHYANDLLLCNPLVWGVCVCGGGGGGTCSLCSYFQRKKTEWDHIIIWEKKKTMNRKSNHLWHYWNTSWPFGPCFGFDWMAPYSLRMQLIFISAFSQRESVVIIMTGFTHLFMCGLFTVQAQQWPRHSCAIPPMHSPPQLELHRGRGTCKPMWINSLCLHRLPPEWNTPIQSNQTDGVFIKWTAVCTISMRFSTRGSLGLTI